MTIEELKALVDAFGAGGGLLAAIGFLAVGVLFPAIRREKSAPKDPKADLVADRDVLVFMTKHEAQAIDFERRLSRVERKLGD